MNPKNPLMSKKVQSDIEALYAQRLSDQQVLNEATRVGWVEPEISVSAFKQRLGVARFELGLQKLAAVRTQQRLQTPTGKQALLRRAKQQEKLRQQLEPKLRAEIELELRPAIEKQLRETLFPQPEAQIQQQQQAKPSAFRIADEAILQLKNPGIKSWENIEKLQRNFQEMSNIFNQKTIALADALEQRINEFSEAEKADLSFSKLVELKNIKNQQIDQIRRDLPVGEINKHKIRYYSNFIINCSMVRKTGTGYIKDNIEYVMEDDE